jgi:hypothetical protein
MLAASTAPDVPQAQRAAESLLRALAALSVQRVLCAMALHAPAMLRGLLLERLSPVAAELLTARFEEADEARGGSAALDAHRPDGGFYGPFYGAFPEPHKLLTRLLELKEQLAADALERVIAALLKPSRRLLRPPCLQL